jgi:probable phosphoglycerate mutase
LRRPALLAPCGTILAPVSSSSRRFAFVRHGRTEYNAQLRLNGDPQVPVSLSAEGRAQIEALRPRIDALAVDLGVHTRFPRTRQTLDILLAGRDVPRAVCPDLDDVRLGRFEGAPVEEYRAFRRENGVAGRPPGGGESRLDVLARYARGFARLLEVRATAPLAVIHDIPIRFLANAVAGADPLDGPVKAIPNASLTIVGEEDLRRGIAVMRERLAAQPVPDPLDPSG